MWSRPCAQRGEQLSLRLPRNDSQEKEHWNAQSVYRRSQKDGDRRACHTKELAKVQRWENRVGELSWRARTMREEAGQAIDANQRPMCLRNFRNNQAQFVDFTHSKTEAREIQCPAQDQQRASPSTPEHRASYSQAFWPVACNRHVSCEDECQKQENGFNAWLITLRTKDYETWKIGQWP